MSFFKRKKTPPTPPAGPSELSLLINAGLRRLSVRLSRREQRMTLRQKKLAITGFCLVMGVVSMAILYRGLFVPTARAPSFLTIPSISRPVSPHLPDSMLERYHRTKPMAGPGVFPPSDSITK